MVETLTTNEIDDQIELRKVRLQQVVTDIRAVLRADFEAFVTRETKKAFLGRTEVAEAMSVEKVAALKKGAIELGKSMAARIDGELGAVEHWAAPANEPANPRDLAGVPGVWAKVADVEQATREFLQSFGFGAETVTYKLPAYFVAGLYMPSLVEHFWRLIVEVRELDDQRRKLAETSVREKLQSKWDEAG